MERVDLTWLNTQGIFWNVSVGPSASSYIMKHSSSWKANKIIGSWRFGMFTASIDSWNWEMDVQQGHQGTVKITCKSLHLAQDQSKNWDEKRESHQLRIGICNCCDFMWFLTFWRVKCLFIFQNTWWALPNRNKHVTVNRKLFPYKRQHDKTVR